MKKKLDCILLVEDDIVARFLFETIVQEMEITNCVDQVSNGKEALEYLQTNKAPNIIILDLHMPVLGGLEFLEIFKFLELESKEKIKIIVLSSSSRTDDVKKALELGAVEYLVKPVSEDKIKEVITTHFFKIIEV